MASVALALIVGSAVAVGFGLDAQKEAVHANGEGFDFTTRNRQPPRDPVNALLSFAYAMLAKDCFAAVCAARFRPVPGLFPQGPTWQALAGTGFDGRVPPRDRGFGGVHAHLQRDRNMWGLRVSSWGFYNCSPWITVHLEIT